MRKVREKKCEIINCNIIKLLTLESFRSLESLDDGHVQSKGTHGQIIVKPSISKFKNFNN